ncbi:MAG: methyltransferase domain-containing protein, partial [Treponema sp.]|nr:methyltransferase domain-containing protein [Treponema sp.]
EKNFITRRYFTKLHRYVRLALERLDNGEGGANSAGDEVPLINGEMPEENENNPCLEINLRLNDLRLAAVVSELKACGAKSVIDLGCGEGNLLRLLLKEKCFASLAGSDVSLNVLERAADKLKVEAPGNKEGSLASMAEGKKKRLVLFQSSLCYRDRRFTGYDAAVIMEVIEHLDENRLPAICSVIFGDAAPNTVIITTPNNEFNIYYPHLEGGFRHPDHRFEWNRAQFRAWAEKAASTYGYSLRIVEVGQHGEKEGCPTQMGIFTKIPQDAEKTEAKESPKEAQGEN